MSAPDRDAELERRLARLAEEHWPLGDHPILGILFDAARIGAEDALEQVAEELQERRPPSYRVQGDVADAERNLIDSLLRWLKVRALALKERP